MYHAHFRGTHYEAGFRWGSLLLKHKNIILENIPLKSRRNGLTMLCPAFRFMKSITMRL
mgnify:CR=1 FL=1